MAGSETRTTRRARHGATWRSARALEQHADVADAPDLGRACGPDQAGRSSRRSTPFRLVDAETRGLAETTCWAGARHDASDLGQIGKRILDVVAPEVGESPGGAVLAAEEARAARCRAHAGRRRRGPLPRQVHRPSHVGAMLKRHLLALANPARHDEAELSDETGDWKPLRRRLGEAFVEYVERYPADRTPQTAGVNATIVVTMTLEQLLAENATRCSTTARRMSAGQARRLACEAGIIPAVLARSPSRSTSAAPPGSSTRHNASPSPCATAAAPPAAARPPRPDATPTTTTRGPDTASPTWPRAGCCVRAITGWPTTRATRCGSTPTTRSPSPGGSKPARRGMPHSAASAYGGDSR